MTPVVDVAAIDAFMKSIIALNPVYRIGGKGANEFDCYKFFKLTQKILFGRDLPDITLEEGDSIGTWVKLVLEYRTKLNWFQIDKPVHGCAVEMTHSKLPYHIGTWLSVNEGGVLHCTRGAGVAFSSLQELKISGWYRLVYDIPNE